MKPAKDNFSKQSEYYKAYRPIYPSALYDIILKSVAQTETCWDCATGNGQAAAALSKHFGQVYATDLSPNQLKQAPQISNIEYSICRAESSGFSDNMFDLITVAQALHWFDTQAFFEEAQRVLKPDGIIAVWGYKLISLENQALNELVQEFYHKITAPYWDPERKHIDEAYGTITFPFKQERSPIYLSHKVKWTIEQMEGYFRSWSAVQHQIRETGDNPVDALLIRLKEIWPEGNTQEATFPIFLRVGKMG